MDFNAEQEYHGLHRKIVNMINNVKLNRKPSDVLRTSNETTKTVDSTTGY